MVDFSNPCEAAAFLRDKWFNSVGGGGETQIRYRTETTEREVRFGPGKSSELRQAWWQAEDDCRALTGLIPIMRRFAIRGGSRRSRGWFSL